MDRARARERHPPAPVPAELFEALAELRRPATTQELATRVGRHPNSVRVQLRRLVAAGLVERRVVAQARGRPRHDWVVAPRALPGGRRPDEHAQLGRWLARAMAHGGGLRGVERTGREIGRELAPSTGHRAPQDALLDAFAALGFAPEAHARGEHGTRFVLGNCPYRDAVAENQPAVCTLHRGITRGLLDRIAKRAELEDFVPHEPYRAGCVVDVAIPAGA